MAQQQDPSLKKRGFMSGLAERQGGEGKIQWTTSKPSQTRKSIAYEPSLLHLFIFVVVVACITEYTLSCGSSTLIAGLILITLYSTRSKPHDNIPMGPGYIPYFGHVFEVIKHWNDFFEAETKTCLTLSRSRGYYSTSTPLGRNFIFVVDPKIVDLLFRLQFGNADKGEEIRQILRPILGKGIFISDGNIWKKHRAIASRMFTVRSLRDYMFEVFNDTTDTFVAKCEEICTTNGCVDMYDMYNRLTLEAFTMVAFGVQLGVIECAPKEVEFSTSFDAAFQICTKRFFDVTWPVWKALNIGRERTLKKHINIINEFANEFIQKKREHLKRFEANNSYEAEEDSSCKYKLQSKYDIMWLFLKDGQSISDEELRDIALNFIIAGRDTTAQLLSWCTYLLSKEENQHVYRKIMQEMDQHIGDGPGLDFNAIAHCKYLEKCFLESLRLRPSVPHLVRYAKVDIALPNGDIIRKGDGIVVPTFAMGRMPWIWKDPLKFNPDRFNDENQYTPSQYPAFNIPPRLCLGKHVALLEAKIAIIKLFKKYKLEPVSGQDVAYEFSVTHQMKNGFKVKLIPRES